MSRAAAEIYPGEHWQGSSVPEMFAAGLDTADIARILWRSEASVLREINVDRAKRLGLPDPTIGGYLP